MRYILALDQGTTSSRAILFDAEARRARVAQREFRQIFPQPGWVEHDPKEIWRRSARPRARRSRKPASHLTDLMAVGITNQRETTILWDRQTGEPIHNAIVWQDRRTAELCAQLKKQGAEKPDPRTNRAGASTPTSAAPRSRGCSTTCPARAARAERGELAFGTVDTWLIWHLTGGRTHVTDASNASRTLLFNIHTGDWDDGAAAPARRAARDPARRASLARTPSACCRRAMLGEPLVDRRHRGRPAGGAVRPGLPSRPAWRRTPTAPAASCS